MKKLMIITLSILFMACTDQVVEPDYRAEVLEATPLDGQPGLCHYKLGGVVPYAMPAFNTIDAPCGKYRVGQVIYF